MKSINITTSPYNEEECLPELFSRITSVMEKEKSYSSRILVMDNGLIDQSQEMISEAARKDDRINGFVTKSKA